ncbi:LysR family transcriptional regulator [Croceibacterium sp. TMG7-5b_MA50]|uniref:LysR family transcriptional regulator n=1 Tax=Croceibacterium sp. TMG7-5b_MA50 TaxID=3121290 RepID=UPI00322191B6
MKRTHLPLNALRVFDAAARHLSFTRAADELAVTPAAVGQQIRALEDVLGVVLFRRTSRGLELTGEAEAGLDPLREGFLRFEEAVQAMQAGQSSHAFALAVPREFYAQWLAPRLASFRAANPQVRFQLVAEEDADFTEANLDAAVRLVEGPDDLEGVELSPARRVTVAAPGAPAGWITWPGCPEPEGEGEAADVLLQVGNAGQALSSALAGLGRTTLPLPLVEEALAAGRLEALGPPAESRRAYWLVAPRPQWRQAKVRALVVHLVTPAATI